MQRLPLLCCITLSFLLLSACAFVAGQPTPVPRVESRYDDAGIKTEVSGALLALDPSQASTVNVHCFYGHVFLVGEGNREFCRQAVAAAEKVPGANKVSTHWFPSGSAFTHEDAAIEAEISERLPSTGKDAGRRIDADVWGGHVVLTGMVHKESDIQAAVTAVKRIKNVRSVTSYIVPDNANKP
ncbi:MAG: BON domain-containing protein [Desulfovibrio sp.]|jgi:osmotically-inducible protein OsmY|nr:BON domain-containing protein [Desulfovibrio sp.]